MGNKSTPRKGAGGPTKGGGSYKTGSKGGIINDAASDAGKAAAAANLQKKGKPSAK